uniref:inositol 1,4,5-trisphosphate receptor-interacting protein-like isoform X1 n=2 Tax=Myxine glutinosa TaxID=7769 RepID=UPI00358F7C8C
MSDAQVSSSSARLFPLLRVRHWLAGPHARLLLVQPGFERPRPGSMFSPWSYAAMLAALLPQCSPPSSSHHEYWPSIPPNIDLDPSTKPDILIFSRKGPVRPCLALDAGLGLGEFLFTILFVVAALRPRRRNPGCIEPPSKCLPHHTSLWTPPRQHEAWSGLCNDLKCLLSRGPGFAQGWDLIEGFADKLLESAAAATPSDDTMDLWTSEIRDGGPRPVFYFGPCVSAGVSAVLHSPPLFELYAPLSAEGEWVLDVKTEVRRNSQSNLSPPAVQVVLCCINNASCGCRHGEPDSICLVCQNSRCQTSQLNIAAPALANWFQHRLAAGLQAQKPSFDGELVLRDAEYPGCMALHFHSGHRLNFRVVPTVRLASGGSEVYALADTFGGGWQMSLGVYEKRFLTSITRQLGPASCHVDCARIVSALFCGYKPPHKTLFPNKPTSATTLLSSSLSPAFAHLFIESLFLKTLHRTDVGSWSPHLLSDRVKDLLNEVSICLSNEGSLSFPWSDETIVEKACVPFMHRSLSSPLSGGWGKARREFEKLVGRLQMMVENYDETLKEMSAITKQSANPNNPPNRAPSS